MKPESAQTAVIWVDGATDADTAIALAGTKIGRLVELHRCGVQVPPGFAITTTAYLTHCRTSGLDQQIGAVIAGLGPDPSVVPPEELTAASDVIIELFGSTALSPELREAIIEAYDELCLRSMKTNVPTAVRSSATGEDASEASFAGIFDTYLGVSGPDRLIDAVRSCWGSLFNPRALTYRLNAGTSHHEMPMAVGVIELVQARASGVAFSVHPVSGKRDRIVVETNWGWGEAVVQGLVNPDHAEIGKSDRRLLNYRVSQKSIISAFDFAQGRVREFPMPGQLVDARVLDDEQLAAIVDAVITIERHYGYPVDIEWVLDRNRRPGDPITVVQSRPVTVLAADIEQTPEGYDPVAMALRHVFGSPPDR